MTPTPLPPAHGGAFMRHRRPTVDRPLIAPAPKTMQPSPTAALSDSTWSGYAESVAFATLDARLASADVGPRDSLVFVCPHTARAAVVLLWLLARGRDIVLLPPEQAAVAAELSFCPFVLTVVEGAAADDWGDVGVERNPGFVAAPERPTKPAPRLYVRTSGSMGRSKLVCWTHAALLANAAACVERFGLTADDRVIIPVPITHMYGLGAGFLPSVLAGAACDLVTRANIVRYLDRERVFDPDVAFLTPALCEMMVRRRRSDRAHRLVVTAGARIEPAVVRAFDARFGPLVNLYGSSEMGAVAAHRADDPLDRRAEALGDPLGGMTLTLRDDGTAGESGELLCHAEHGFAGYVDCDGRALSSAPRPFSTRDRVRRLGDGTLLVLGRMDNAVNRDGRLVMFADIERALEALDEIREAVVVRGVGGSLRGPKLVAWYVPRAGEPADGARKAARSALPPHALPETFNPLDALPRLPSGKVDRQTLIRMTTDAQ